MQEEWRFWKESKSARWGYRYYEISNTGKMKINGVLQTPTNKDGEYTKYGRFVIYRLVAELFIPNPDNKPCVDHIDGNKENNNVTNLRWVTYQENRNNTSTAIPLLNKMQSAETREKCRKANIGRVVTEQTRYNISKAKKGKPTWTKGKTLSEETKQKISATLTGTHLSENTKEKLSLLSKNTIWINNGIITKRIKPEDLENYPDFVVGRKIKIS